MSAHVTAPVLIHADDTTCFHGTDGAHSGPDGQWICPAGQEITRVRIGDRYLTTDDAAEVFQRFAASIARALQPLLTAFAEFGRQLAADPTMQALARAYEQAEAKQTAERLREERTNP